MVIYKPSSVIHHYETAKKEREERLKNPLHYYLKVGDLIAFRKELRAGSSPFVKNNYGRNVLDAIALRIENLLISSLCTSFPIDELISSLQLEQLIPGNFTYNDISDLCTTLYSGPEKAIYNALADGDVNIIKKIDAPQVKFDLKPRYYIKNEKAIANETIEKLKNASNFDDNKNNAILSILADNINRPITYKTLRKLQYLIKEGKVLLLLYNHLASCDELVNDMLLHRKELLKIENSSITDTRYQKPIKGLFFNSLTIPYLYTNLIKILLELYPNAPDGVSWNPRMPTDVRVLCGIICRLELPGNYIILFLAELLQLFCNFITILPRDSFNPKTKLSQYLLHMSYILDVPLLFKLLCEIKSTKIFNNSPFNWATTLKELNYSNKTGSKIYYEALRQYMRNGTADSSEQNNYKVIQSPDSSMHSTQEQLNL